jgi:hypothetical protein
MSAFELEVRPTFREIGGRFVKATRELLKGRREMMREQGRRFVELAGEEAPGGAGRTVAKQIGFETFVSGDAIGFRTRLGQIAKWHVSGTGRYGPRGRDIRPVKARALHFFSGGTEVFARSVRGVRPNKFIGRAYRRWLPSARPALATMARKFTRTIAAG